MSRVNTADDLPVNFLKCRAFGHAWEEFVPVGKRAGIGYRFSLLCTSCGMERHDGIDVNGEVTTREYVQPKGYKLDQSARRSEFRLLYDRKRNRASIGRVARRGNLEVVK